MAIDTTDKKRKIARDTITQVTAFVAAHSELIDLLDMVTNAGVTFVDADFTDQLGLKHLDAATFNAIAASITAIQTTLQANSAAHWKAYLKLIA
jgi:hypothetical protein